MLTIRFVTEEDTPFWFERDKDLLKFFEGQDFKRIIKKKSKQTYEDKKNNKVLLIAIIVGVLIIVGVVIFFLTKNDIADISCFSGIHNEYNFIRRRDKFR